MKKITILTRAELTKKVGDLDEAMTRLLHEYPDDDSFWFAFDCEARAISGRAGAADHGWAQKQIGDVLVRHGLRYNQARAS